MEQILDTPVLLYRLRKTPPHHTQARSENNAAHKTPHRQDNRRVTASHVSFHRLKKRQAESLTCRITPIGVVPHRRHPPHRRMSVKMTHECRIPVADRHHLRTEALAMSGSPPNRLGPAALRLRPPVCLGTGFWTSNLARAWFSASRRLSTSRRAAGLMV